MLFRTVDRGLLLSQAHSGTIDLTDSASSFSDGSAKKEAKVSPRLIDADAYPVRDVMEILLLDRTTGKATVALPPEQHAPDKPVKRYTVMARVRAVKQPRGGYINPKLLQRRQFSDGRTLSEESVHPTTIGMVVDYLTRLDQGDSAEDAFGISAKGAERCGRTAEF